MYICMYKYSNKIVISQVGIICRFLKWVVTVYVNGVKLAQSFENSKGVTI